MATLGDVAALNLRGNPLGSLRYLAYVPSGPAPAEGWPLLLFLHGAGERGDDLARIEKQGLPRRLRDGARVPAVVLAPQCPEGHWWSQDAPQAALASLLDDAEARRGVDPERVLATGLRWAGSASGRWP